MIALIKGGVYQTVNPGFFYESDSSKTCDMWLLYRL